MAENSPIQVFAAVLVAVTLKFPGSHYAVLGPCSCADSFDFLHPCDCADDTAPKACPKDCVSQWV